MSEEWKKIFIHEKETRYSVSTFGNVRNDETQLILKQPKHTSNYCVVRLYVDKKKYDRLVHRLVMHSFVERDSKRPLVNHIDGVKRNNHLINLEYVTHSENQKHAFETGLRKYSVGVDHPMNKHSEETIHNICELLEQNWTNKKISKYLNISKHIVSDIRTGRAWTHISCLYDLPESPKSYSIDENTIHEICKWIAKGYKGKKVLEKIGLPNEAKYRDIVNRIRNKGYFKEILNTYIEDKVEGSTTIEKISCRKIRVRITE